MKKMVQYFPLLLALLFTTSAAYSADSNPAITEPTPSAGLGIQIEKTPQGDFLVDKTLDHSPAQSAGLESGDFIEGVQTNPQSVMVLLDDKSLDQVVELIRGPVGVEETLLIKRTGKEFTVSAIRQPLSS